MHNVAVPQQLGFQGSEGRLTQACFVTAFEILDIEEGLLVANARMLARYGHLLINWAQIDIRAEATLGIYSPDNCILLRDGKTLHLYTILLVTQERVGGFRWTRRLPNRWLIL